MIPNKDNINLLKDGNFYWVKYKTTWSIGRYDSKFIQFRFTDGTICDLPNMAYVDPIPIVKPTYLN